MITEVIVRAAIACRCAEVSRARRGSLYASRAAWFRSRSCSTRAALAVDCACRLMSSAFLRSWPGGGRASRSTSQDGHLDRETSCCLRLLLLFGSSDSRIRSKHKEYSLKACRLWTCFYGIPEGIIRTPGSLFKGFLAQRSQALDLF